MPTIVDYASLVQSVTDFTHRSDLAAYADYFIQAAQEMVNKDIFDENMGNGIRLMENAYGPTVINGGTAPYPADWIAPKTLQVLDQGGDVFPLVFQSATWIYNQYPVRQPVGFPAFIARDVMAPTSFTGSIAAGVLTVTGVTSGIVQTGLELADGTGALPTGVTGVVTVTDQTSGTTGGVGTYSVSNSTLSVASEVMTGGGSLFIFGPYPDAAYTIRGTYYQRAPTLTSSMTTNWMVTNTPTMLHAACMLKASIFSRDTQGVQLWEGIYSAELEQLINQDKAERWAAGTLQVEVA